MRINEYFYRNTVIFAIVISFFLGAYALEVIGVKYVSEGGGALFKIHLYSYIVISLFFLYYLKNGMAGIKKNLGPIFGPWIFLLLSIIYLIIYGLAKFGTAGMAYIVDTLLVPVLIFPVVFSLKNSHCWLLMKLLFLLLVSNVGAAIFEYSTSTQLFAYEFEEHWVYFRSTAFWSHPLNNALISSFLAIFLFRANFLNPFILFSLVSLSLFCFGARTATAIFTLFALVEVFQCYKEKYSEKKGFAVTDVVVAKVAFSLGVFVSIYAVFELGFGQRIFENIAFDGSARTRYDVFQVFSYLSLEEWIFGARTELFDNIETYIDNAIIENYVISWILLYGLLGCVFLIFSFYWFFFKIYVLSNRTQKIAVLVFLLVSISNNSLSTKNPALLIFFIAFIASLKCHSIKSKAIRVL